MVILLVVLLLILAGSFIAYSLSPATGARRRVNKAILPLRSIDSELRAQYQSVESYLTLPFDLWPEDARLRIQEIQGTLAKEMRPTPYRALLKEFGCDEELSSSKSLEFVKALTKVSMGFEPDVLGGARRPRPAESVVVFMLTSLDDHGRVTPEYQKASLTIGVAATVALADEQASDSEADAVDQGYIRGGVTVFGSKKTFPVFVDETIEMFDTISVSAGVRGMQILLAPADYIRAAEAQLVVLTRTSSHGDAQ
jgi:Cys-tRNA(Pro)/Cys-tRNA(Cys) deacylase